MACRVSPKQIKGMKGKVSVMNSSFNDLTCNEIDIVEALKELDPYSAAPDGEIPARILTTCSLGKS